MGQTDSMLSSGEPHFLDAFVNPRSIAVFGANESIPENMGAFQLLTLIDNGYQGKIYPIHPKLESVFGLPAFPSVLDVPGEVDLAEIILPKRYVPQVLEELGQKGCKNVILVTAGFREQGNYAEAEHIRDIAKKYGMHLLGPNCIGIINAHCHYTSEKPGETCVLNVTVQSYAQPPGNVSIISQSGTFVSHVFMLLSQRDLGLSKTFSVGNEMDIDLCDCLEYLAADPTTDVIVMYIEEVKRGRRFIDLARQILPHKPIICLYVGDSEGGSRAGASHTGAVAGTDGVFDGVAAQAGLIRVETLEQLLDTAALCAKFLPEGIVARGGKVAVVTNSGGPGAMMADRTTRRGMALPEFSGGLQAKIMKFMPPTAQVANPLDYTFSLNPVHFYQAVPKLIAKSGEVDAMLVYGALGEKFFRYGEKGSYFLGLPENRKKMADWLALSRASIDSAHRIMRKYSFPIINVNFLAEREPMFSYLNEHGFPTFPMPHQAVDALYYFVQYCRRFRPQPPKPAL